MQFSSSARFFFTDRVAGLLEANGVFNVKLLVNRVRVWTGGMSMV